MTTKKEINKKESNIKVYNYICNYVRFV